MCRQWPGLFVNLWGSARQCGCQVQLSPLSDCSITECYDPENTPVSVTAAAAKPSGTSVREPLIAAAAPIALLLLATVCAAATASAWPHLRSQHSAGDRHGSASHASGAAGQPAFSEAVGPVSEGVEVGTEAHLWQSSTVMMEQREKPACLTTLHPVASTMSSSICGQALSAGQAASADVEEGQEGGGLAQLPLTNEAAAECLTLPAGTVQELRFEHLHLVLRTQNRLRCWPFTGISTRSSSPYSSMPDNGQVSSSSAESGDSHANGSSSTMSTNSKSRNHSSAREIQHKVDGMYMQGSGPQQGLRQQSHGGTRDKSGVLCDVSGHAQCREVLGILGPSGSGKSSLMNMLAGQVVTGRTWRAYGSILLNGVPAAPQLLWRAVGHVPQDDVLLGYLTVGEALRSSAVLQMEPGTTPAQVAERVSAVMAELGISSLRHRRMWSKGRASLSGGEARRISIAMQLVTSPPVLLLDEPTSGLDSYTAAQLMQSLAVVAAAGRVVVTSLHQPSPKIFHMLNQVLLLAHGHTIYYGPPSEVEQRFLQLGVPCAPLLSPAEHMLQAVSDVSTLDSLLAALHAEQQHRLANSRTSSAVEPPLETAQPALPQATVGSVNGGKQLAQHDMPRPPGLWPGAVPAWPSPPRRLPALVHTAHGSPTQHHAPRASRELAPHLRQAPAGTTDAAATAAAAYEASLHLSDIATPWRTQVHGWAGTRSSWAREWRALGVLTWRSSLDVLRTPQLAAMHCCLAVIMGVLVGAVYYQSGLDKEGAQNRLGGIFFIINIIAFISTTAIDWTHVERPVVQREMLRNTYSPTPYMMSKLMLDALLLRLLPALLMSILFYFMMGLRSSAIAFTTFLFTFATFSCLVGALSLAVSTCLATSGQSILVVNLVLLLSVLFSGFLANRTTMTWVLRWLAYISPIRYCWEALVINELRPLYLYLKVDNLPALPDISGTLFLDILGVDASQLTTDLIVLAVACIGFFAAAVVAQHARLAYLRAG